MMVNRCLTIFLYHGLTDVHLEILNALFQVILDEMKNKYAMIRTFESKIEGVSWTVYYKAEEENHLAFKKSIEDTFKPGFFVFGKEEWNIGYYRDKN